MKKWLDSIEADDNDDVFQVETKPANDSPFAFPVEGVGAGVPLVYERGYIPDAAGPVTILEGGFLQAVERLVGRFADVEVPDSLAALTEDELSFESDAP